MTVAEDWWEEFAEIQCRAEKVTMLRIAIASGTYCVHKTKLAESLLRSLLLQSKTMNSPAGPDCLPN